MTRLITRGFDSGVLADEVDNWSGAVVSTARVRTGTYSLRTTDQNHWGRLNLPVATDNLYVGFGIFYDSRPGNEQHDMFQFRTSDSEIAFRSTTEGALKAYRGATEIGAGNSGDFNLDTWHYMEIWAFLDNSSGRIQVLIDGQTIIDFTGDTLEGSDADITWIALRGQQAAFIYFDDLVVNDDAGSVNNGMPGIISLTPLVPNATGDTTQLVRGGTDSGNNWDQVNEVPADAVSYVYGTGSAQNDLYGLENFVPPTGAVIQNVIVQGRSQLDSGSGEMKLMIKSGSAEAESTGTFPLNPGWDAFSYPWDFDPSNTGSWTQSAVDALQAGFKAE